VSICFDKFKAHLFVDVGEFNMIICCCCSVKHKY
jgi:hypothetical protein